VTRAGSSRRGATQSIAVVGGLIALLGLAFVARSLAKDWDETREIIRNAQFGWLVLAVPFALAGMTAVALPWRRAIELVGGEAGTGETLLWYFPSQMGKYVPGGVWGVVGRGEIAVRGGVSRAAAYSSVGLSLATTYLAAILLAAGTFFPAVADLRNSDPPLWVLLLLPAGLIVLHPRILNPLMALCERALGKSVEVTVPSWRDTVVLILMHLPAWWLIGTATWCVARAFTEDASYMAILFATSVSWVVGFVVIGVPGGLGVREATFVAVLGTAFPPGVAAATAVVARLIFMLVDSAAALIATVAVRVRRPDEVDAA
jgi:uncharacterized membrane protein YbhN (UPF0104 family)